jgi:hypothetical protein
VAARRWAPTVAAACLLGTQAIHTAVMPGHLREWWAQGAFFLGVALVEGALAAALLLAPGSGRVRVAAVAASVATVCVWAWSRTIGMPVGPGAGVAEPVGRADAVATLLEVATAAVLLRAAVGRQRPVRSAALACAVAAVALVTAFGLSAAEDHAHAGDGGVVAR